LVIWRLFRKYQSLLGIRVKRGYRVPECGERIISSAALREVCPRGHVDGFGIPVKRFHCHSHFLTRALNSITLRSLIAATLKRDVTHNCNSFLGESWEETNREN
jgi:hypothetical protein